MVMCLNSRISNNANPLSPPFIKGDLEARLLTNLLKVNEIAASAYSFLAMTAIYVFARGTCDDAISHFTDFAVSLERDLLSSDVLFQD